MTDKEKIRAEIKRQYEEYLDRDGVVSAEKADALHCILSFIDSLQEESKPKFKVGQTITDPTDSTIIFHINKIENGRYIEKEDEWVLVKEADANYELVEEPVSEDMEAEFLRAAHNLREQPTLSAWFRHFYNLGKQQIIKDAVDVWYDEETATFSYDKPFRNFKAKKAKLIIIKED